MKLTEKQRRFADEYVRTGNATEAARLAGYRQPHVQGSQNLEKLSVKSYIDKRLNELKKKSIAEQDEILQFLTAVMRGEHTEQIPVGIGEGAQQLEDKDTFLKDRVKAAELLGKRYVMWTDKQQVETITPVFVEDVPDED
jgi:phage terminase small subunit